MDTNSSHTRRPTEGRARQHRSLRNRFPVAAAVFAKPLPCTGVRVSQRTETVVTQHDRRLVPVEMEQLVDLAPLTNLSTACALRRATKHHVITILTLQFIAPAPSRSKTLQRNPRPPPVTSRTFTACRIRAPRRKETGRAIIVRTRVIES
jgi:hypothetical protein